MTEDRELEDLIEEFPSVLVETEGAWVKALLTGVTKMDISPNSVRGAIRRDSFVLRWETYLTHEDDHYADVPITIRGDRIPRSVIYWTGIDPSYRALLMHRRGDFGWMLSGPKAGVYKDPFIESGMGDYLTDDFAHNTNLPGADVVNAEVVKLVRLPSGYVDAHLIDGTIERRCLVYRTARTPPEFYGCRTYKF